MFFKARFEAKNVSTHKVTTQSPTMGPSIFLFHTSVHKGGDFLSCELIVSELQSPLSRRHFQSSLAVGSYRNISECSASKLADHTYEKPLLSRPTVPTNVDRPAKRWMCSSSNMVLEHNTEFVLGMKSSKWLDSFSHRSEYKMYWICLNSGVSGISPLPEVPNAHDVERKLWPPKFIITCSSYQRYWTYHFFAISLNSTSLHACRHEVQWFS